MTYRVVYLDHVARLSGGEIALARILSALNDQVDAHVIVGEDGPLVERLRDANISVEVLPMAAVVRDIRKESVRPGGLKGRALAGSANYVWRLRRRLRELAPDVVHTNSLKAALYGGAAGRLAGIPVVWHIRDRIAPDYLPTAAVWAVRASAQILPSAVIANSRSTLKTIPRLHKGVTVVDPVIYDRVGKLPPASEAGRPYRIGVVGRLAPWKGQAHFIDAFARAFPNGDCEAWIIGSAMFGEDNYAASLREKVRRSGLTERIEFRGFRDDIWDELAQIDTLVHCSLTPEPFGQVVVEGMVAGIPVIASDAGGPAEIITDGVDGILTSPGDAAALADAMRRLHNDPSLRHTLAARGRKTALRFSPEHAATQVIAVYGQVTSHRR